MVLISGWPARTPSESLAQDSHGVNGQASEYHLSLRVLVGAWGAGGGTSSMEPSHDPLALLRGALASGPGAPHLPTLLSLSPLRPPCPSRFSEESACARVPPQPSLCLWRHLLPSALQPPASPSPPRTRGSQRSCWEQSVPWQQLEGWPCWLQSPLPPTRTPTG